MNRSKAFPKILILLIVTAMCFGFISTVQARVNMRPIEDWLLNNPTGSTGNYANDDYTINIGNPFMLPILQDEIFLVEGETTFDGYILERVLNDGSVQLTVNLWVFNAPLTVYKFLDFYEYILWWLGFIPGPVSPPEAIIGAYEDGYIDYKYQYVFNLPSPGMEIPNMWDIYFSGAELRLQIIGKGYGTFSENAAPYFTPGATGMVTLNQICLTMPQLEGLDINKLYGTELWPIELINIQQIR